MILQALSLIGAMILGLIASGLTYSYFFDKRECEYKDKKGRGCTIPIIIIILYILTFTLAHYGGYFQMGTDDVLMRRP